MALEAQASQVSLGDSHSRRNSANLRKAEPDLPSRGEMLRRLIERAAKGLRGMRQ